MNTVEVLQPTPDSVLVQPQWYALQTRPRHEKKIAAELELRGVNTFLPLVRETRQWSDRRMQIDVPLFSCYVFVNLIPSPEVRATVLRNHGVLNFVGSAKEPLPIPDNQIEQVRTVVSRKVPFAGHPFLSVGQRVRIRGGALDGIEGILERRSGNDRLVISVQTIQRSLSINVEGYHVEAIEPSAYRV
jgi:transcription antitermination factor NusG